MGYLFTSLTEYISPQNIKILSDSLKEKDQVKIYLGLKIINSSILDLLLKKGETVQLKSILLKTGNLNILMNEKDIFTREVDMDVRDLGSEFLRYVFKEKTDLFMKSVSISSGLPFPAIKELIYISSFLITGFLGEKFVAGITIKTLLDKLESERSNFISFIPFGLTNLFEPNLKERVVNKFLNIKHHQKWIKPTVLAFLLVAVFLIIYEKQSNESVEIRYENKIIQDFYRNQEDFFINLPIEDLSFKDFFEKEKEKNKNSLPLSSYYEEAKSEKSIFNL